MEDYTYRFSMHPVVEGKFEAPKLAEECQMMKNDQMIKSLKKEVSELRKQRSDLLHIYQELHEKTEKIPYNSCVEVVLQEGRSMMAKNEEGKKALVQGHEDASSNTDETLGKLDNLVAVSEKAVDVMKKLKPHSKELRAKRKTQNEKLALYNQQISDSIANYNEIDKQVLDMNKGEMFMARIQQKGQECDDLAKEAQNSEAKNTLADQEFQDLQQKVKELKEEVASLQTEHSEIKAEIEDGWKRSKKLKKTLKMTNMKLKEQKKQIKSISKFMDNNSQNEKTSAGVIAFEKEMAAISHKIGELQIELSGLDTSNIDKRFYVAAQESQVMLASFDLNKVLTETGCSTKSQVVGVLSRHCEQIGKTAEEWKRIQSEYYEKLQPQILDECQIMNDVAADEDRLVVAKEENIQPLKKEVENGNWPENEEELKPGTSSKNYEEDEVQIVTMFEYVSEDKLS